MISAFVDGCRSLLVEKIHSVSSMGAERNADATHKAHKRSVMESGLFGLPGKGKKKQERTFEQLAETIPVFVENLRRTTGRAEVDFLRLGEELQTVYSKTTELARQIVGAISIIESEDGSGILQKLQSLVSKSLTKLTSCRDEAADKEVVIRRIATEVAGLDRYCSEAERMATYLTVIGFNIRIESAQREEFEKLFGVIAGEIRKSSGSIVEIIEKIRDDAARLCHDQTQISYKIATDLTALGSLADQANLLVSQAFKQIEELVELACEELGRAGEHSKILTGQVGQIVMGIQLHDSMNQRIEHIIEALEDIERIVKGNKESIPPAEMLDILNLQQAHLQYMVSEVEEVYGKTLNAFESIGSCVDQLTGSLAGFAERRDSHSGDSFGQLTEAFVQLDQLLGDGTALIVDIDGLAEKTAAAAGKLSSYLERLQDISFNTRLIGLNSIVNAARLGEEGEIFELLSNQLTGMTEYSDKFVGSVEGVVGSVKGEIEKNLMHTSAGRSYDSVRDLSIGEEVTDCSTQYDRFHDMSTEASGVAVAVKGDLARIRGELDFLDRLRAELLGLTEKCGELVSLLRPWEGAGQKNSEQYRQELVDRYTMKQERDIHDNLLSMPTLDSNTIDKDDEPEEEVVLFSDGGEDSEQDVTETAVDEAEKPRVADENDSQLGDNVELF